MRSRASFSAATGLCLRLRPRHRSGCALRRRPNSRSPSCPALRPTAVPIPGNSTEPASAAATAVLLGRTLGSCKRAAHAHRHGEHGTGALQLRADAPVEALITGYGHLAGGGQHSRLHLERAEVVAVAVDLQAPAQAVEAGRSLPRGIARTAGCARLLPGRPAAACPPRPESPSRACRLAISPAGVAGTQREARVCLQASADAGFSRQQARQRLHLHAVDAELTGNRPIRPPS